MRKRVLSGLSCLCIVATLLPTVAFAAGTDTGKAIQFVDSETFANIDGWDSTNSYDYIYSVEEAEKSEYGFTNDMARVANYGASAGAWRLRSPSADYTRSAGAVDDDGGVYDDVDSDLAARPAFNLDLNSVLFTSAVVGSKPDGGLQAVPSQTRADRIVGQWDFNDTSDSSGNGNTLTTNGLVSFNDGKMETQEGSIGNASVNLKLSGEAGFSLSLAFSTIRAGGTGAGAQTELFQFGSLTAVAYTTGELEVTLDGQSVGSAVGAVTDGGTNTLEVRIETDNALHVILNGADIGSIADANVGGEGTLVIGNCSNFGYATSFDYVRIKCSSTAPTLSDGSATRTSETAATVTFTSSEAGEYYYEVVESGVASPTIDTTGTGISCTSDKNIISLNNLSGTDAKVIYIVVKDTMGNVSDKLEIEIPLFPIYTISADTAALAFGTVTEGYTEAPAAKEVAITNTGNQPVTLTQPADTAHFTVDALSDTQLNAGSASTFTVRPKEGLIAGEYSEKLTVSGTYSVSADVELRFVVTKQTGGGGTSGGGGGGFSTYSITAKETAHGTVTVSPKKATPGSTVTVTATPDQGYQLGTLTVTDKDGNKVTLTDEGNGKYTFKMPGSKVTVQAVFTEIEVLPEPLPFADVAETAWYADAVRYVYENGLMNGTSKTAFAPNGTMNRAMLVTILYRLEDEPQANYLLPFDDVAAGTWYTEAVRWAASEGIVTGMTETAFAPDSPVTREQFATILYRYSQQSGADVSIGEDTNILSYADALEISEYAMPAMQWACGAGVIEGSGANLNPQGQATRAEAAAMLMRFCEKFA